MARFRRPIHIRRPKNPHQRRPPSLKPLREMGMPILDDVNGPMRPGAGYINMNIAADGTRVSAVRAFLAPSVVEAEPHSAAQHQRAETELQRHSLRGR